MTDSQTKDRQSVLVERQSRKMARSPHAFVRGNTVDHYRWLAQLNEGVPEGPPVWICGDCHVGNLGPTADADGNIDIQIRDLDQTVMINGFASDLTHVGPGSAQGKVAIEWDFLMDSEREQRMALLQPHMMAFKDAARAIWKKRDPAGNETWERTGQPPRLPIPAADEPVFSKGKRKDDGGYEPW